MTRPKADEYFEYYDTYISKVPDGNIVEQLRDQVAEIEALFRPISEEVAQQIHPPYTWTIKQVMGHLIDTERIFADRLHKFAMGETQAQPGMDQDVYVASADYGSVTLSALVDELVHCRRANSLLVQRLTEEAWNRRGTASGHAVTVRALAWMLVGHVIHHAQIVTIRLL
ncbi:MAG: DinB family protein [Pirellulaceae bacterium]|nr:DinB family protein [Pirellulaceae bacterium]